MIGIEQFATGGDLTLADLSLIAHMNNFIKVSFHRNSTPFCSVAENNNDGIHYQRKGIYKNLLTSSLVQCVRHDGVTVKIYLKERSYICAIHGIMLLHCNVHHNVRVERINVVFCLTAAVLRQEQTWEACFVLRARFFGHSMFPRDVWSFAASLRDPVDATHINMETLMSALLSSESLLYTFLTTNKKPR